MIRTPRLSPFFTCRLCSPIHRLTSLLTCQLALSHTRTSTFLPTATSSSQSTTKGPDALWRSPADRPRISRPRLLELRHIKPVAGDGLRVGIVFGDRLLDQARGLCLLAPGVQRGESYPAPPSLVLEAHHPPVVGCCQTDQPYSRRLFSFRTPGRGW